MPLPYNDLSWIEDGEDVAGATSPGSNNGVANRLGRELLANLQSIGQTVETVEDLVAISDELTVDSFVLVTESHRGGLFKIKASGTDDGGIVLELASGQFAERDYHGNPMVDWWMTSTEKATDASPGIQRAIDWSNTGDPPDNWSVSKSIVFEATGDYQLRTPFKLKKGVTIRGTSVQGCRFFCRWEAETLNSTPTHTAGTATLSVTAHGLASGDWITLEGAGGQEVFTRSTSDVDLDTSTVTLVGHGYTTGDPVRYRRRGGALYRLYEGEMYYIIRIDDDNFQFAATYADAVAGTNIDFWQMASIADNSGNQQIYLTSGWDGMYKVTVVDPNTLTIQVDPNLPTTMPGTPVYVPHTHKITNWVYNELDEEDYGGDSSNIQNNYGIENLTIGVSYELAVPARNLWLTRFRRSAEPKIHNVRYVPHHGAIGSPFGSTTRLMGCVWTWRCSGADYSDITTDNGAYGFLFDVCSRPRLSRNYVYSADDIAVWFRSSNSQVIMSDTKIHINGPSNDSESLGIVVNRDNNKDFNLGEVSISGDAMNVGLVLEGDTIVCNSLSISSTSTEVAPQRVGVEFGGQDCYVFLGSANKLRTLFRVQGDEPWRNVGEYSHAYECESVAELAQRGKTIIQNKVNYQPQNYWDMQSTNDCIYALMPHGVEHKPADTDVDTATDLITVTGHGFATGESIRYDAGDVTLDDLTDGQLVFVRWVSTNTFRIAKTKRKAVRNEYIDLTSVTGTGTFTLSRNRLGCNFTAVDTDVTVGTDSLQITDHRFTAGEAFKYEDGTGGIDDLTDGTHYYAIVVDDDNIKFAATRADAVAATPVPISLTATSVGNFTLSNAVRMGEDFTMFCGFFVPSDSVGANNGLFGIMDDDPTSSSMGSAPNMLRVYYNNENQLYVTLYGDTTSDFLSYRTPAEGAIFSQHCDLLVARRDGVWAFRLNGVDIDLFGAVGGDLVEAQDAIVGPYLGVGDCGIQVRGLISSFALFGNHVPYDEYQALRQERLQKEARPTASILWVADANDPTAATATNYGTETVTGTIKAGVTHTGDV
jgi:hypothetical protein